MEEEVKAGIDKFKSECERLLPGIALVIPVRPTGGNFLISFSLGKMRTYGTISEDDFADWGEGVNQAKSYDQEAKKFVEKLKALLTEMEAFPPDAH